MTEFAGPLIDNTNFPQSEELWTEGGADLEDQLLCTEDVKLVHQKGGALWKLWHKYVRWRSLIGLCVLCCALGAVLYMMKSSELDETFPVLSTKLNNGLYQSGNILSFSPPHLLPNKVSKWSDADYLREYNTFKRMYRRGKELMSVDEEGRRFHWFKTNLQYIHEHNADASQSFTMAPNQFTDMSFHEWSRQFTSLPMESKRSRQTLWNLPLVSNSSLPTSVNWHDKGCVTTVKDQAQW